LPRTKLTEKIIERLKGRPADSKSKEPIVYWDLALPGFGVMVSTKTGLKSFVVQRDMPSGRPVRRTIGLYNTEIKTLDEAREKAGELIHQLRQGIDPRTTARGGVTLKQAADAYLAASPNLAERSKRDYARIFDSYLSDWKGHKLSAISREMVEKRHLELVSEITRDMVDRGRTKPDQRRGQATANSVMRTLRALYNWAGGRYPDVGANPVKLKWFDVARRERHIKADQLGVFYKAVLGLDNPIARDYILTLLFTGLRREEAAGLTWHDVDFTARVIRLPALRTKANRKFDVPLTDVVLRLLKDRRAIGDTEFVFPANSRSHHISEPKHPLGLIAQATGIAISAHDLRRTYSNAAVAAGVHGLHLKALLNHAVGKSDVTVGYISLSVEDLREPAQRVTDQLKRWCKIR
jgi:integrase